MSSTGAVPQLLLFLCIVAAAGAQAAVQPGDYLAVPGGSLRIDAVVSQRRASRQREEHVYGTISDAVKTAPAGYVVYVARGVYEEKVVVTSPGLTLVGEGMGATVISEKLTNRSEEVHSNAETATLDIRGDNFTARELTVRNTAGVDAGPAVAVRSASNWSIFYRCEFEGHQDTLLAESKTQFYKECKIHGTIDFIWGDATAVFQDCLLLVRKPPAGRHNVITAQGRDAPERDTGFSFHNCSVITSQDLRGIDTFLGRPWRNHSHVMFMQSYLGGIVNPQGWVTWKRDDVAADATRTVRYMEYDNRGPGAVYDRRVNWTGFHQIHRSREAKKYTVERFIAGKLWLPARKVDFYPGLYKSTNMHV